MITNEEYYADQEVIVDVEEANDDLWTRLSNVFKIKSIENPPIGGLNKDGVPLDIGGPKENLEYEAKVNFYEGVFQTLSEQIVPQLEVCDKEQATISELGNDIMNLGEAIEKKVVEYNTHVSTYRSAYRIRNEHKNFDFWTFLKKIDFTSTLKFLRSHL